MRGKAPFILLTILILNSAIACVVMVFPQGTADVTIQPARVENILPDGNFTVDITVTGAEDIQAWDANITFDPTVLEVVNASEGEFLKSGSITFFDFFAPEDAGYVYIGAAYYFWGPQGSGVNGNGTLANITFQVKDIGNSPIHFKDEEMFLWYKNGTGDIVKQPRNLHDGFFTNLHDVAVTNLTASPDTVNLGENVSIDVTVTNEGDFSETFNVTTYWNISFLGEVIETKTGVNLNSGTSTNLPFTWDTTGLSTGTYIISAEASAVPDEDPTNLEDNTFTDVEVEIFSPEAPVANFTILPAPPYLEDSILTFNASASYDPNGHIIGYTWNFGDGSTKIGEVVTHTYTAIGDYEVRLTVQDNQTLNSTVLKSIKVLGYPVTSFTYSPEAPLVNHPVTFNASSSTPNGGTIVSYAWDFGDSTSETYKGENLTAIATHTYIANGTFTITLNVTDSEGLSDTASELITTTRKHDVAVIDLDYYAFYQAPKPTTTYAGYKLNVGVTVRNEGSEKETFDIIVYYDNTEIMTLKVTNLTVLEEREVLNQDGWDTAGFSAGEHYLRAVIPPVVGEEEIDIADNSGEIPIFLHELNVAVIDVVPSQTTVLAGDVLKLNVTVQNKGTGASPKFGLKVYYNMSTISIYDYDNVDPLEKDAVKTKVFTWDTTDVSPGNYTLSAYIEPLTDPSETDEKDNLFIYGNVTIGASVISIYAFPESITVGSIAIINGSITPTRPGVNVTIKYRLSEEETWNTITTVTTDENSTYSYDWTPQSVGTYEVKASWEGDMYTIPGESGILTIVVSSTSPSVFLYVVAAAAAIAIVATAIYLLKFRKPKPV